MNLKLTFKLFCIIFLLNFSAFAQADLFQISQKENTESLLKESLQQINSKYKTVYITLFTPQMCPRCEMDINHAYRYIKQLDSTAAVALWCNYNDNATTESYVKNKNFKYDYLITDNQHLYNEIFSLKTTPLRVTLLLKIDLLSGRMIFGGEVKKVAKETYQKIVDKVKPQAFFDYGTYQLIKKQESDTPSEKKHEYTKIFLAEDEENKISSPLTASLVNNNLVFYDELSEKIYSFKKTNKDFKFHNFFTPSFNDLLKNVDTSVVSVQQFKKMLANNEAFIMPNKAIINGEHTACISYSLPDLFRDPSGDIAYANTMSFFIWDFDNNTSKMNDLEIGFKQIILEKKTIKDIGGVIVDHTRFFVDNDKNVVLRSVKGFPAFNYKIDEWDGNPVDYNTLLDEFYDNSYYLRMYNIETQDSVRFFGKPEDIFKYYKSGFSFIDPLYYTTSDVTVYSSGYSGIVHFSDKTEQNKSFKVFDIDKTYPREKAGTIKYINELTDNVFVNKITDIKADKQCIYVLYEENKKNTFLCTYSYKDGKLLSKQKLDKWNRRKSTEYRLGIFEDKINAYLIFREKRKHYLAVYR
ncbi:MAG: hypothetical protein MI739_12230 [Bacteroidales bacterium]|nr:hypothetical protein [Bacteroidales bacterium]